MTDIFRCFDCDFVGTATEASEHEQASGHETIRDSQNDRDEIGSDWWSTPDDD